MPITAFGDVDVDSNAVQVNGPIQLYERFPGAIAYCTSLPSL